MAVGTDTITADPATAAHSEHRHATGCDIASVASQTIGGTSGSA
jgi:hypothetical protein